jgi:ubiquinone/menaquinone biosynthesis C-methylase UbiE
VPNTAVELQELKARLKSMWESGDYGVIARYLEKGALEFLDRLAVAPGSRMLDVACGTGQLAIPAAKKAIHVTGLDVAANLVAQARVRARQAGVDVRIDEGDAESLPYADASFDVVASLFGAMFAPRPELVASEMLRVCKPGGRIVMGNWTPEGHVGQMFRVLGKYVAPPRMPSPLLWGDECTCRQRLTALKQVEITRHMYPFESPFGPEQVVDVFIRYYGPTCQAHSSLSESGQQALRRDLTALWTRNNKGTNGSTRVMAEYLEITGTRP